MFRLHRNASGHEPFKLDLFFKLQTSLLDSAVRKGLVFLI